MKKTYVQPNTDTICVEAAQMIALSLIDKAADNSECFVEEQNEHTTHTDIWGEEW